MRVGVCCLHLSLLHLVHDLTGPHGTPETVVVVVVVVVHALGKVKAGTVGVDTTAHHLVVRRSDPCGTPVGKRNVGRRLG